MASNFVIPKGISYATPIYVHSHASTFRECIAKEHLDTSIEQISEYCEKIRRNSLSYMQKWYNTLAPDAAILRNNITLNKGEIATTGDLQIILNKLAAFRTMLGSDFQISRDIDPRLIYKAKDKIGDLFEQSFIKNMKTQTVEDRLNKTYEKLGKKLKATITSTDDLANMTLFQLLTLNKEVYERDISQTLLTYILNYIKPQYNNEFFKKAKDEWNKLKIEVETLLQDVNADDLPKDKIIKVLNSKTNLFSRIGDLAELLMSCKVYQQATFVAQASGVMVEKVDFTGDTSLDALVSDITLTLNQPIITSGKIGINVKESTIGPTQYAVAGQLSGLKNSGLFQWSEQEWNQIKYIITNYEALKRFNLVDNKTMQSKPIIGKAWNWQQYDMIERLQWALVGYNLMRTLIGTIVIDDLKNKDINQELINVSSQKGLPYILSVNSHYYWTDLLILSLKRQLESLDFENMSNSNLVQIMQQSTESTLNKIFNNNKLLTYAVNKQLLEHTPEDEANGRLKHYFEERESLGVLDFQLSDATLTRILYNNARISFDVEKIYQY